MRFARDPSRRRFLTALGAGLAWTACQSAHARVAPRRRSRVAVLPAPDYARDLTDVVARGFSMLGASIAGRRVLLKPNLIEYAQDAPINTHPAVVAAAAEACFRAGARDVIVAEASGHRRDIEYLLVETGLRPYLDELELPFVDLNHDDVLEVPLPTRRMGLAALWLPRTVLQAEVVISIGKLKTHHWTGFTAALKNMFGVVPGAVYGWPKNLLHVRGIEHAIVDINAAVRPDFAIVDAVVGMEGDGPISGTARPLGCIVMGADLVAVDATCARMIGVDPLRVPYLSAAARVLGRAGEHEIEQLGEAVGRYHAAFALPEPFKELRLDA